MDPIPSYLMHVLSSLHLFTIFYFNLLSPSFTSMPSPLHIICILYEEILPHISLFYRILHWYSSKLCPKSLSIYVPRIFEIVPIMTLILFISDSRVCVCKQSGPSFLICFIVNHNVHTYPFHFWRR